MHLYRTLSEGMDSERCPFLLRYRDDFRRRKRKKREEKKRKADLLVEECSIVAYNNLQVTILF